MKYAEKTAQSWKVMEKKCYLLAKIVLVEYEIGNQYDNCVVAMAIVSICNTGKNKQRLDAKVYKILI